jgi:hypothetical protein
MIRLMAFAALLVGAGWWTAEPDPGWHRPDGSASDLAAALSDCPAEAILPAEFDSLARCMSEHGWAPGASTESQITALR